MIINFKKAKENLAIVPSAGNLFLSEVLRGISGEDFSIYQVTIEFSGRQILNGKEIKDIHVLNTKKGGVDGKEEYQDSGFRINAQN